ncbi:MAG: Polyketide cyclase / dehydrase and lipid transport [Blastococcus sp.]|nr:Polyketide cyclase / dehydrase and lipid transport [Blastococcus sp.]
MRSGPVAYGRQVTDQLISESTTIDAPPDVVFAILADPRQHSRIDGSGSVGSVIAAPERLTAKGQTFTLRMKLFGVPYLIRNRVVEFEAGRRIAWRHFTANRWRYELAPTADGGTTVTETFDTSRANKITDGVVRWAKFPERNREGIVGTLERLKKAAEKDAV